MDTFQKENHVLEIGRNRMLSDLLFDLAAGDPVDPNWTYEQQLNYYKELILPGLLDLSELVGYGQKYKSSYRYMFANKPEKVKNRKYLLKLFSTYIFLKEAAECNDYSMVSAPSQMADFVVSQISLTEEDQRIFTNEIQYLSRKYAEGLKEEDYQDFREVMGNVSGTFEQTYKVVVEYVLGDAAVNIKSVFGILLETYDIPREDATKFHLEVDAIAETTAIKNEYLEYMEEFKAEWERHFPKYRFGHELEEYVKTKKQPYRTSYGNNISSIRNESFLFLMLADVTVKLALVEGVKNLSELTRKIKELTIELGCNVMDAFIASRENVIRGYHLAYKGDYPSDIGSVLIPYRTDLMYLRDIIIEEISFRNAANIVQKQSRKTKDAGEYELLLSQKDAEIYDLKRELEYYENIKQQEFKAEISQYNKALTDLFRKMCDFKYHSPLNELYLLANGLQEVKPEEIKGLLQNLMFILSTMNIVPYETGNVGKKVKFYDDEANTIYAVDDNKVKPGLNKGIQTYPGWKYKDAELVLPRVEIEDEE